MGETAARGTTRRRNGSKNCKLDLSSPLSTIRLRGVSRTRLRALLVETMAQEMPLTFTGGHNARHELSATLTSGHITLESGTAREVCFYLAPNRRVFTKPAQTLREGRATFGLVLNRRVIQPNWQFSPCDIGELQFHWREDELPPMFGKRTIEPADLIESVTALEKSFAKFLDLGFEDPWNYLLWETPRTLEGFGRERNDIYLAAKEDMFGRPRRFTGAWTYEVRGTKEVTISPRRRPLAGDTR